MRDRPRLPVLCAAALGALLAAAAAAERPNVVILLADDLGWADVGYHGEESIRTPSIDRLAREGVQLDRFYATPICSPTRAALLTGRVVAVMRWPARIPAGSSFDSIMSVMDVFPTLADAARVPLGGTRELDGRSLWPAIAHGTRVPRDELLLFASETPIRGSFSLTAFDDEWATRFRWSACRRSRRRGCLRPARCGRSTGCTARAAG